MLAIPRDFLAASVHRGRAVEALWGRGTRLRGSVRAGVFEARFSGGAAFGGS